MLGDNLQKLCGKSVLIATYDQLYTALALIELDGLARRVVLCTPDLSREQLGAIAARAQADAILLETGSTIEAPPGPMRCWMTLQPVAKTALLPLDRRATMATEWVLLSSSDTSEAPTLVPHMPSSLTGEFTHPQRNGAKTVWSTFHDIRRYDGLQIYLRAVSGNSDLVLPCCDEPVADFLARAGAAGVTHLSGAPSHWRRALTSGAAALIQPRHVRLSGEIADQAALDSLRIVYPDAHITHVIASTVAGIAFDVDDGLAGFPANYVDSKRSGVDLKVENGTLRIRCGRGGNTDGYTDSGDPVDLVDGRYYFRGHSSGANEAAVAPRPIRAGARRMSPPPGQTALQTPSSPVIV